MVKWWIRRRHDRLRRQEIGLALRAEFELEPLHGLAALRGLVRGVGELERARMTARAQALVERSGNAPTAPRTTTRR